MIKIRVIDGEDAPAREQYIFSLVKQQQVKQIGKGKFGAVFAPKDGITVTKVCQDKAYLAYIQAVSKRDRQKNPWFPKIKAATVYRPVDDPWYMSVEMERLRKGSGKETRAVVSLLQDELDSMITIATRQLEILPSRLAELKMVRNVLRRLAKQYAVDYHCGNVMFRDNHAVITDPVVDWRN